MDLHESPVLHRGPYCIHERQQQITFRDGSSVQLHLVSAHGLPADALRALPDGAEGGAARWLLLDLRQLAPLLADDLPTAAARDKPGLVLYHLRFLYPSAADFRCAAAARNLGHATVYDDLHAALARTRPQAAAEAREATA